MKLDDDTCSPHVGPASIRLPIREHQKGLFSGIQVCKAFFNVFHCPDASMLKFAVLREMEYLETMFSSA